MKRSKKIFSLQVASSLFMILALLWLTISTPFVYAADDVLKKEINKQSNQCEEETNPFSNTTEEKNESSVSTLSEYLHDAHSIENGFNFITKYYNSHPFPFYLDHHPKLLSPPPKS